MSPFWQQSLEYDLFFFIPGGSDVFSAVVQDKTPTAAGSATSFRDVRRVYLLLVFPRILDSDKHNKLFSSSGPDTCTYTTAECSLYRGPALLADPV